MSLRPISTARGVTVAVNGEPRGDVPDAAFARALLRVWLGDHPADAALRRPLLGHWDRNPRRRFA